MAQIIIVGGHHGGALSAIAAILEERGHAVTLVCEESKPAPKPIEIAPTLVAMYDYESPCTPNIEWRKERDYPTLREGIRRKQIKNLRK